MPKYQLVDGEERCKRNPRVYEIPPKAERENLPAHCWVELGFIDDRGSTDLVIERMLVQVEEREEGTDVYYGKLGCRPDVLQSLTIGDEIQFQVRNILAIVAGE